MTERYRTIVVDPPWPIKWTGGAATRTNGRGERHVNKQFKKGLQYPTMTLDQIAALDLIALAGDDCHLFCWTTDEHLMSGAAREIVASWGFERQRLLVWEKTGYGLGSFPRPQHEVCIIAVRGRTGWLRHDVGSVHRWKLVYENGARKHSAKPDGFFDLVESASPGPYLELFARRQRLGWDTWGNQALEHVEVGVV